MLVLPVEFALPQNAGVEKFIKLPCLSTYVEMSGPQANYCYIIVLQSSAFIFTLSSGGQRRQLTHPPLLTTFSLRLRGLNL